MLDEVAKHSWKKVCEGGTGPLKVIEKARMSARANRDMADDI